MSSPTIADTKLDTWFERDRAHVCLSWKEPDGSAGDTIVEWWDGAVKEAVDDGFLDPRDYHGSAFAYAEQCGLLVRGAAPVSVKEAPKGWVASHPEFGVYMGWERGGAPVWSRDADEERLAKGAYAFSSEEQATESFEGDAVRFKEQEDVFVDPEDISYHEVDLDLAEPGRTNPTRCSTDACEAAGIDVCRPAAPAPR